MIISQIVFNYNKLFKYYEKENLVNNLSDNNHSSIGTLSKQDKEKKDIKEQNRYKYYNAFQTEKQLDSLL